ncbi:MAG: hypothetical protein AVDCRST_MAG79-854, partial [uncultured Thermoleophilia bacterium]
MTLGRRKAHPPTEERGAVRGARAAARSLGLAVCVAGMVAVPVATARAAPVLEAQARALGVLALTLQAPVASALAERLTRAPVVEERTIAGVPATVVRPPGRGPFPAVVFVNGATPDGRRQPDVRRLGRALGRVGFLTVVPDPPGLARGAVTTSTLAATTAVTDAVARRPDVAEGRLALVSVSVGASLALLVAADERVA